MHSNQITGEVDTFDKCVCSIPAAEFLREGECHGQGRNQMKRSRSKMIVTCCCTISAWGQRFCNLLLYLTTKHYFENIVGGGNCPVSHTWLRAWPRDLILYHSHMVNQGKKPQPRRRFLKELALEIIQQWSEKRFAQPALELSVKETVKMTFPQLAIVSRASGLVLLPKSMRLKICP